ncbi:ATP-binding protein [Streptomyces sp. NPDC051664]|uniref:ATP-binding protein n=1 Tax=Streptomyces sp. NPDC051664 TaxID=3365668 RepID=UPI0037A81C94
MDDLAVTRLKKWHEVARPHDDIADGSFEEARFAADLGLVAKGDGPADYLDPVLFTEKTYLTENLRVALVEIGSRLSGDPAANAVYRMQTEFGGGKTHTLLAAYHLFGSARSVADTRLARELAKSITGGAVPQARVVVLDGSALTADCNPKDNGTPAHTLLGHLAYKLGGAQAYEAVRAQDEARRGTSTTQLVNLLREHSPCLILMDETLEYLAKTLTSDADKGSLTTTTLTIIKELNTAVANVPGACLVATLTASHLEDFASVNSEDLLERLSKIFGRTEATITPVEGDDIFPVLHTRLFKTLGSVAERRRVADAYGTYYSEQFGDALPSIYREPDYRDRIEAAYPFHPELIDILTNRWGSLSGFQRTRGALRILSHTIKALYREGHASPLIHAGDLPLYDPGVRAEVLRFAGESYKAALNADIIRPNSRARQEDKRRGGEIAALRATTGLATTAFVSSFSAERVLGASDAQMIVGVGRPGLSRGQLEDVRDTVKNIAFYMRYEGGRYRFTTEPNLNKVIVERESAIAEAAISALLAEATSKVAPPSEFWRTITGVRDSSGVSDVPKLTLALLDPENRVEQADAEGTPGPVQILADRILTDFNQSGRTNKNTLVVIAPDSVALGRARSLARTVSAMRDLQADGPRLRRFNQEQQNELRSRIARAEDRLPALLVLSYRHVYMLTNGIGGSPPAVLHQDLGPARASETVTDRVTEHLRAGDALLDKLAPAALLSERFKLLPSEAEAIEIEALLHAFQRYPRLPKLASAEVLRECLRAGVQRSVFALVSGSQWRAPDAVIRLGEDVIPGEIDFQPGTWLVRAPLALDALAQRNASVHAAAGTGRAVAEPSTGRTAGSDASTPQGRGSERNSAASPMPGAANSMKSTPGPTGLRLRIAGVPADKVRDVVKVAVLQFATQGAEVTVDFDVSIRSPKPIAPHIIDLVLDEGLGQLGLRAEKQEE